MAISHDHISISLTQTFIKDTERLVKLRQEARSLPSHHPKAGEVRLLEANLKGRLRPLLKYTEPENVERLARIIYKRK